MDIHNSYRVGGRHLRRRRVDMFKSAFPESDCASVVDLGGGWRYIVWEDVGYSSDVLVVNLDPGIASGTYRLLPTDATATGLPDRSFDLAYSNSLIEHLGTLERQQTFAAEMFRLSDRVWCQTLNKWFPAEPHFLALFLHSLPTRWQKYWMFRWLSLWGWVVKPTREQFEEFHREVRLLTKGELRRLFPGCRILTERFFGLPKAYVMVKNVGAANCNESASQVSRISIAKLRMMFALMLRRPTEFLDRIRLVVESLIDQQSKISPPAVFPEELLRTASSGFQTDLLRFVREPACRAIRHAVLCRMGTLAGRAAFSLSHNGGFPFAEFCYAIVRARRPEVVVETGVGFGVTTAFILAALAQNEHGTLYSVDLPPLGVGAAEQVGFLVPEEFRSRWRLVRGSCRR